MSQSGVRVLVASLSGVRVFVDVTVWCQGFCGCHSLVSGFLWMSQSGVRVFVDVTVWCQGFCVVSGFLLFLWMSQSGISFLWMSV